MAASLAALGTAAEAAAADYPFTTTIEIGDGDSPEFADVDGDGDGDIVTTSGGGLMWLENPGDLTGTFAMHPVETTMEIDFFAVGDIDGDGDTDLVGSSDEGTRWYENVEGAQAFVAHDVGSEESESVTVGDFNGDGNLDIAIGHETADNPGWYQNPGDATGDWGAVKVISSALFGIDALTAGDYDGDGDDDLAALDEYNDYFSLLTFESGPWNEQALPPDEIESLVTADFDGDGDPDIIGSGTWGWVVHTNVAPGVFGTFSVDQGGETFQGNNVRVGDVDADGDLDLINVTDFTLLWYENDGGAYTMHDLGDTNANPEAVSVMDADCDGDADVVVGTFGAYGTVTLYINETVSDGDGCDGGGDPDGGDDDGAADGGSDGDGDGGSDGDGGGGGDDGDGDGDGGGDDGDGGTGGDDGEGGTGGADGGADEGGGGIADGLCSVDRRGSVPMAGLALFMLALGFRRRR